MVDIEILINSKSGKQKALERFNACQHQLQALILQWNMHVLF